MNLKKQDLVEGLAEIGVAALAAGKIIDLAVYGGSCLMLVSNFRDASQDVDAVAASDQVFVDRIAAGVAERRGWPQDWLNDGVRVYLSPLVDTPQEHALIATYPSERSPGLRVYVPTPEYMLAMKLMALRIDEIEGGKDKNDIDNLIAIVGVENRNDLIALASRYYPEARVSAKLILAARQLVDDAKRDDAKRKAETRATPRYLDRSGGGEPRE